ncbi:TPA: hypothetical protein ENS27_03920 [bacterium]|nr:hypothetical protein [bacterium]
MIELAILLLMMIQFQPTEEYVAKKGDTVMITVWERESLSGTVFVDSNGNITLPMPIGSVQVVGKTANQISQILTDRLKEYLINPSVFVSLSPSEGFNVHVLGEVLSPNFVKVPEGTTVQEAIARAGGFTKLSNTKRIRLIRTEEDIITKTEKKTEILIDFDRFIENNELSSNPVLKTNDVIIVPRLSKTSEYNYIAFFGAVNSQGIKEVEKPLSLVRAIALAGGLSNTSSAKDIYILSASDEGISRKSVNFEKFLNDGDLSSNPIVNLGDMVFVPTKPEDEPPFMVSVSGQVTKPGKYAVKKGSRVLDAIYEAGGFADDAVIDSINVVRIDPNNSTTTQNTVNIKNYLSTNDLNLNPILMEGDNIFVPLSKNTKIIPPIHQAFLSTMSIDIMGEVAKPGTYQVSTSCNLLDIIKIAGGYTSNADIKKIIIVSNKTNSDVYKQSQNFNLQKVLKSGDIKDLPELSMGDMVFIPQRSSESVWRTIVRTSSEISTIFTVFYIIIGRWR